MILDEAIKHAEEVAEKKERYIKRIYETLPAEERFLYAEKENECKECAKEHRQLAEWLKELKQLKEKEPCQDIKEYYKDIWDCDINHPLYEDTVAEIVEKSYISGYAHGVENTAKEIRFGLEQETKMENGCTDVKTTNKDQLLNGFVEMMKGLWNNQDLKAPNLETLNQEPCDPCDDCISRKAVEDTIFEQCSAEKLEIDFAKLLLLQRAIKALPPVTPQPKIGRWINIDATHSKCDRCGAIFEIASENGEANYCLNCGCKMEVEE